MFSGPKPAKRLMCWPHTSRNLDKNLITLKKDSKNDELPKKVKSDVASFQWATTENEYQNNFKSLKEKSTATEKYTSNEKEALKTFFTYLEEVWGPDSEIKNWYAGANPWHITQNQGIEGKNKAIKKSYTFKSRVSIAKLIQIFRVMLKDWSQQDDSLLFLGRLALLDTEEGLKLKTEGWKWAQRNKRGGGIGSVMKVERSNRWGRYSVSEAAGLGEVQMIWVLGRKTPRGVLADVAKMKLEERANPSKKSFDEKMKIKESCWIVEERDGDFFCDCESGFKGHLCQHTIGMHYRNKTGRVEESDQVRSLPLGSARGAGRPKGTGRKKIHCLAKSPTRIQQKKPVSLNVSNEVLDEVEVQICTSCEEEGQAVPAVWHCEECPDFMCTECGEAHKKTKITKSHKLKKHEKVNVADNSDNKTLCTVCEEDGEKTEAAAYCMECQDNLCSSCKASHRKNRQTKSHTIVEGIIAAADINMPVIVLLHSTPPPPSAFAQPPCQTDERVGQEDATPAPVEQEFVEISQEMVQQDEIVAVPAPVQLQPEETDQEMVQQEETTAAAAPVQFQPEETNQKMVEQEDAPTTSSFVLPAGKVSCTTCGAVVIKKGIKIHERTAACIEARTSKRKSPASLQSPASTPKRPRTAQASSSTPPPPTNRPSRRKIKI